MEAIEERVVDLESVVPLFASMALSRDFVQRLTRLKLYGLALGQRTMELLNFQQVRAWTTNGH